MKKQNIITFIGFLTITIFIVGIIITNLYSTNWHQSKQFIKPITKNNQQSTKTQWFLNPQKTLKQNVQQWGRQAGWTVIWHAKNYKVQSQSVFHGHLNQKNGPFEQLVKQYGQKNHFLKINLHLNDRKIVVNNDSKALKKHKKIVQNTQNKNQSKKNKKFKLVLNQIKKRIKAQEKEFKNQNNSQTVQTKQKMNKKVHNMKKLHAITRNDHINGLINRTQSNFVQKSNHKKNTNQNNKNNEESNAIAKAEEKLKNNQQKQNKQKIQKHTIVQNKNNQHSNHKTNKVNKLVESNAIAKAEGQVTIKNKRKKNQNTESKSHKTTQSEKNKKKIVNQKQNNHVLPINANKSVIKQNNLKNDLMPLFIYEHSGVVLSDQFNILKQGKIKPSSILSFNIIAHNDLNEVEINVADSILNQVKQEKKVQKQQKQQRQEKSNQKQNKSNQHTVHHKRTSQSHKSGKTQSKTKNHIKVGSNGQYNLMVYLHNTFKITKNIARNMVKASWASSSQYNINSRFMLSFLSAQVKLYGNKKKQQYADFPKLIKDVHHFNKLLNQNNHNIVKTIMDFDHMPHKTAQEYNHQIKGIYTNINRMIKATNRSKQ